MNKDMKKEMKMLRKKYVPLTEVEKKNPLGILDKGMSDMKIIESLKDIYFLDKSLKLTERGKEFVKIKLENMSNVERIMIERYILEHHNIDIEVEYMSE